MDRTRTIEHKLEALPEISQKKLLIILEKIVGFKDFIIDDYLMKPLERIIGASKLRKQGVDKIYKLNSDNLPLSNGERVFFINSDLTTVKKVCDIIASERSKSDKYSHHLILVSRKLCTIDRLLEEEGLHGVVNVYVFQWELIPLDKHLLSLECNHFYKTLFVDKEQTFLHTVAKSIWTLHLLFGKPYLTLIQGKYSEIINKMVGHFYDDLASPDNEDREITHFIILDRDLDYVSTLLTGFTYTSLLDEEFGINSGIVDITKGEKPAQFLNGTENIYSQIKSRPFSDVFPFLSKVSKQLQATQAKSKTLEIAEMKRFITEEMTLLANVKKSLAFHISACEAITVQKGHRFEGLTSTETNLINCTSKKECLNFIEESLIMNVCDRYSILRLLCLLSITQDGLTQEEYTKFKTLFLQIYGFQYLPVFFKLEQANLCTEQAGIIMKEVTGGHLANKVAQAVTLPRRSTFSNFANKLKLIPNITDDYDFTRPKDAGYVFGGNYIPVACQIVNMLANEEHTPEEIAKMLPNCSIKGEKKNCKVKNFIVYFVGGVTYAEISAFQLLEKLTGTNIIVAGSSIINGNSLMKAFFP